MAGVAGCVVVLGRGLRGFLIVRYTFMWVTLFVCVCALTRLQFVSNAGWYLENRADHMRSASYI